MQIEIKQHISYMTRAFLSHSSADKVIVRRIAEQIGRQKCVLDEWSFDAGEMTLEEIYRKLDGSDIFVLFLSDKALESPWVKKEIARAKTNIKKGLINKIFPIIIDPKVEYNDPRIPKWMVKSYNLRKITNERVLLKKIQNAIRSIDYFLIESDNGNDDVFVGRNKELQYFEQEINNIDDWVPLCIVANGYYEGIGRRTFLRNALERNGIVDKYVYRPITISIDAKQSIESFIYQLNYINPDDSIVSANLTQKSNEEKINIAVELVNEFIEQNEILFIVDDGGVVRPDGRFVDWFYGITRHLKKQKAIAFCLVSTFKPRTSNSFTQEKWFLSITIPELSSTDTKSLFIRLLKKNAVEIESSEDKELFLRNLRGIPQQVIYAVSLIKSDINYAKQNISEIVEFSDRYSSTLLGEIKKDFLAYQITIFLAKNEIVGLDIIEEVFGDVEATRLALQKLYDLSAFTFVFDGKSHIKLNETLADYIGRIKETLDEKYRNSFINARKKILSKDLDELVCYDYSAFLITIQELLDSGRPIPSKYYMPSLLIKYVTKMYDSGKYDKVINICESLLANTNYDSQILRETKYLLLQSYARVGNDDFFKFINDFYDDPVSYHFLKGFFFRFKKEPANALREFSEVIKLSPSHSRTLREIVNIYLSEGRFEDALPAAKNNFYQRRNNIFHLQSYFIALSRRKEISVDEKKEIEKLLSEAKNLSSSYQKAMDIYSCMKGEYEYFILKDFPQAESTLKEALFSNENKSYPYRSLKEIYRIENKDNELGELEEQFGRITNCD